MNIKFTRFPWQKISPHWSHPTGTGPTWGWKSVGGMGRFGGGWNYKLGIAISGKTIIIDLLIGSCRISFKKNKPVSP